MTRNKKGRVLESTELFKSGFFRFRTDKLELSNKKIQPHYYVMEFSDWVNVVALTTDNQVIMVSQYRHAIGEVCLEIPGGALNSHTNETPEMAALRELTEETGYVAKEIKLLGYHEPNPALQNNKIWTYLALGCEKTKSQELDAFEDIEVSTMSAKDVLKAVKEGKIRHSLIIAALHLAEENLKEIP